MPKAHFVHAAKPGRKIAVLNENAPVYVGVERRSGKLQKFRGHPNLIRVLDAYDGRRKTILRPLTKGDFPAANPKIWELIQQTIREGKWPHAHQAIIENYTIQYNGLPQSSRVFSIVENKKGGIYCVVVFDPKSTKEKTIQRADNIVLWNIPGYSFWSNRRVPQDNLGFKVGVLSHVVKPRRKRSFRHRT